MTENTNELNDNVYLRTEIEDSIYTQSSSFGVDTKYTDKLSNDKFDALFAALSYFINDPVDSFIVSNLSNMGVFNLSIDRDADNPELLIDCSKLATSVVLTTLRLTLTNLVTGGKYAFALAKTNVCAQLVQFFVEDYIAEMITYGIIKEFYSNYLEGFDRHIAEAKVRGYIKIDAKDKSFADIRKFIYYTGILEESKIHNIYIEKDGEIYSVLRKSSDDYKNIIQELNRRGYFDEYFTETTDDVYFSNLTEYDTKNSNQYRQDLREFIGYQEHSYAYEDFIILKDGEFTFPFIGNEHSNIIYGDDKSRILYGDLGDDLIYGGSGNDEIYGDKSFTSTNAETVLGNNYINGNDILVGGLGDDKIYADFYINGQSGNNLLVGDTSSYTEEELKAYRIDFDKNNVDVEKFESENDGNDIITGGRGNDIIFGGGGNDSISGVAGTNYIYGGSGEDEIYGGIENDYIYGGKDDDFIQDSAGINLLFGNEGHDEVRGGAGEDTLIGDSSTLTVEELHSLKNGI